MAGFFVFAPFRMILTDEVHDVFFCFNVIDAGKIIYIAVADLAAILHFRQSSLQQQAICTQVPLALPKQAELPSFC
jgi:hypothetical protein